MIVCSVPGCDTTAGCQCNRLGTRRLVNVMDRRIDKVTTTVTLPIGANLSEYADALRVARDLAHARGDPASAEAFHIIYTLATAGLAALTKQLPTCHRPEGK